jgi:hypothetical protein
LSCCPVSFGQIVDIIALLFFVAFGIGWFGLKKQKVFLNKELWFIKEQLKK